MAQPVLLALTRDPDLLGTLLRVDAKLRLVAHEDGGEALAAARKADVWLFVVDARNAEEIPEGLLRKIAALRSQPELLVLHPQGLPPATPLPPESRMVADSSAEHVLEQARRLVALQRVRQESGIVGVTPGIRALLATIAQVGPLDVPVLVHGESGTGKEMVARALHDRSSRAKGPFLSINVGSLAETLLESELFGHEKGAFTGAIARRAGVFERANGGTLFLDELGEMSPAMQVKLLRVLETSEFQRVGGHETLRADVRIVAATHRDLEEEMHAGRFRGDLYYRLKVVRIDIPPLRDRADDILLLADQFLAEANAKHGLDRKGLTLAAMERLRRYAWPGNVRELRNVISSMAVMATGSHLDVDDLPDEFRQPGTGAPGMPIPHPGVAPGPDSELWTSTLLALLGDVRRLLDRVDDVGHRLGRLEQRLGARESAVIDSSLESLRWEQDADEADYVPIQVDGPTDIQGAERALIAAALRQHEGNRRRAAEQLGISERTLYRKLKRYGLG